MTNKRLWLMAGAGAMIGIVTLGSIVMMQSLSRPNLHQDGDVALAAASPKSAAKPSGISYDGQDGRSALELLKDHAFVVTHGTGTTVYVTSINGYRANDLQHEYWAFYLNGELSDEGALQYITHSDDKIEWKLATY